MDDPNQRIEKVDDHPPGVGGGDGRVGGKGRNATDTPFDCELPEMQGVADFQQTMERLAPEELVELLAQMQSDGTSSG